MEFRVAEHVSAALHDSALNADSHVAAGQLTCHASLDGVPDITLPLGLAAPGATRLHFHRCCADPKTADPKTADPKTADTKTADPKTAEGKTAAEAPAR